MPLQHRVTAHSRACSTTVLTVVLPAHTAGCSAAAAAHCCCTHLCCEGCFRDTQCIALCSQLFGAIGQCCVVSCCLLKELAHIPTCWRLLHQLKFLLLLYLLYPHGCICRYSVQGGCCISLQTAVGPRTAVGPLQCCLLSIRGSELMPQVLTSVSRN